MIAFQPMSLRERLHRILSPAYRRRRDDEMLAAIRELVRNPSLPCVVRMKAFGRVGGLLIPDGSSSHSDAESRHGL